MVLRLLRVPGSSLVQTFSYAVSQFSRDERRIEDLFLLVAIILPPFSCLLPALNG